MNRHQPLSPHLQIYKLPLTALISICNRAMGVALSLAMLLLVALLTSAAMNAECYNAIHAHLTEWYGTVFLMLVTFALFFHMCNGIRHLFWDIGVGFDLSTSDLTAKLVIVATLVLTGITWLLAFQNGVAHG